MIFSLQPVVNAENPGIGFMTDMARLYDDHILSVMCVRVVAVGSDNTANTTMVERKAAEAFGDQDNRITLIIV